MEQLLALLYGAIDEGAIAVRISKHARVFAYLSQDGTGRSGAGSRAW